MVVIFSAMAMEDSPEDVMLEEILEGRMEPVMRRRDGRTTQAVGRVSVKVLERGKRTASYPRTDTLSQPDRAP